MIKKIIGIILSLAVVAVMVFALLGAGTYRSILPDDLFSADSTVENTVESTVEDTTESVTEPMAQ